jgi:hypothetical protein
MFSDELLLTLNKRGLFPGPKESDEAFFKRISALQAEKTFLSVPQFDLAIDWIDVTYGNKNLALWEGAATWISPEGIIVQIKQNFLTRFYDAEEIIQHELVHASRATFEEPIFEEFFAYKVSKKPWRRFLGPIIQSPKESYLFLLLTLLPCIHLLGITPLIGIILLGFFRLFKRHKALSRCAQNLQTVIKNQESVWHAMLRLSDKEIIFFSHSSHEQVIDYIQKQKTCRWRMIRKAYSK